MKKGKYESKKKKFRWNWFWEIIGEYLIYVFLFVVGLIVVLILGIEIGDLESRNILLVGIAVVGIVCFCIYICIHGWKGKQTPPAVIPSSFSPSEDVIANINRLCDQYNDTEFSSNAEKRNFYWMCLNVISKHYDDNKVFIYAGEGGFMSLASDDDIPSIIIFGTSENDLYEMGSNFTESPIFRRFNIVDSAQ